MNPIASAVRAHPGRATTLLLLTLTYAVSLVDRQILSILQEQVKHEFHLSDASLGMLTGLSFAIFYGGLAIPIAWLADRTHRVNIVAAGFAIWSMATAACGFAHSYLQLMLFRIGVAVGEAASLAPSQSIIATLYAPRERGRALAILSTGAGVGMVVGLPIGGWIASHYGWRAAFLTFGAPGLLLAALVKLGIREPAADPADRAAQLSTPQGFPQAVAAIMSNRASRTLIIAHGLAAGFGNVLLIWLPSLMIRTFHMAQQSAGFGMAALSASAIIPGLLLGGHIGDKLVKRSGDAATLVKMSMVCVTAALPALVALSWMPSIPWLLLCCFLAMFLVQLAVGPVFSLIQASVAAHQRALAGALAAFGTNVVGLGIAPTLIGYVSDVSRPALGDNSLRLALSLSGCFLALAIVAFVYALREAPALSKAYAESRDASHSTGVAEAELSQLL
jgi:MFS family permease